MPNEPRNSAYGQESAEPPAPDSFVSFVIPRPRLPLGNAPADERVVGRARRTRSHGRAFLVPRPRRSPTEPS
ncbi:hypothetical protein Kisp01_22930 [Kineosporia sp. NBRC 101677]|nr:hypothetical protein Kisp01_22930 [Kineosporia sp. NBRC 101677]